MQTNLTPNLHWRTPEELITLGFERSRVVMMNEAHGGHKRCPRTRRIGQQILPAAHARGVRHLAMEALMHDFTQICNSERKVPDDGLGYLGQPEMKSFIQAALDLGWTLVAYEADINKWLLARHGIEFTPTTDEEEMAARFQKYQKELLSMEFTNWRETQQAENIIAALNDLPANTPMLVWCGNGHHTKVVVQDWVPMGWQFEKQSGITPFCIDQTRTVDFGVGNFEYSRQVFAPVMVELEAYGGTAGFLMEESPIDLGNSSYDAYILSTENDME